MLDHEDNLNEPSQAAAQARVTPQAVPRSRRGLKRRFFAVLLFFSGILVWIVSSHFRHSGSHAAPIWRPLSVEPDGKILYADSLNNDAVFRICDGRPASQIIISENDVDSRWTLFKMADHVYLRGYIAHADSLRSLQGHTLEVFSDGKLGGLLLDPDASKITLRIDRYGIGTDDDDDYSNISVPNFQPDSQTMLNDWH